MDRRIYHPADMDYGVYTPRRFPKRRVQAGVQRGQNGDQAGFNNPAFANIDPYYDREEVVSRYTPAFNILGEFHKMTETPSDERWFIYNGTIGCILAGGASINLQVVWIPKRKGGNLPPPTDGVENTVATRAYILFSLSGNGAAHTRGGGNFNVPLQVPPDAWIGFNQLVTFAPPLPQFVLSLYLTRVKVEAV